MRDLIQKPIIENLPRTGYYLDNKEKKEKVYKNEPHIHKQGPFSGVKAEAHKFYNDILTYFPKGFAGSKNSDFYEYLSLGMVPYVIGSALLIGLYSAANGKYNSQSASAAGNVAKRMGAGVVLYGVGKWLSKKVSHKLIKASTGVDLDMKYLNKITELPENGNDKGITRIQYPGVFDSADFPRKDLIAQDSELNYNNVYAYEDKIAKKAGFKDKLNAPNQVIWPKIRELKVRTTALENINKYIVAGTGVALGSQKAFEDLKLHGHISAKTPLLHGTNFKEMKGIGDFFANGGAILKNTAHNIGLVVKDAGINAKNMIEDVKSLKNTKKLVQDVGKVLKNEEKLPFGEVLKGAKAQVSKNLSGKGGIFKIVGNGFKQLWRGTDRNLITKHYGKALIIGSAAATLLTWLIPTVNFKKNPDTMKSKIDGKKDYEVC